MKHYSIFTLLILAVFLSPATTSADFAGGDGTELNPFQIADCQQLQEINTDLDAHYILNNDIDCTGIEDFDPIGNIDIVFEGPEGFEIPAIGFVTATPFEGTLNGNNFAIQNLVVISPDIAVGIFEVTKNARIFDLELSNNIVSSTAVDPVLPGSVGVVGLAFADDQYVDDFLSNIHLSALNISAVDPQFYVGGLVGAFYSENSFSLSNISGQDLTITGATSQGVGGLIGYASSDLTELTFTDSQVTNSTITGFERVGGLIGDSRSVVTLDNVVSQLNDIVADGNNVGGLVGYSREIAEVQNSSVINNNLTAVQNAGGLIGYTRLGTTITDSSATLINLSLNENAGGLIGYSVGPTTITDSTVTDLTFDYQFAGEDVAEEGKIYAPSKVGGLVGLVEAESIQLVGNSVDSDMLLFELEDFALGNLGNLEGGFTIGGLVGELDIDTLVGEVVSRINQNTFTGNMSGSFGVAGIISSAKVVNQNLEIDSNILQGEITVLANAASFITGAELVNSTVDIQNNESIIDIYSIFAGAGFIFGVELKEGSNLNMSENFFQGKIINPLEDYGEQDAVGAGQIAELAIEEGNVNLSDNYVVAEIKNYLFISPQISTIQIASDCTDQICTISNQNSYSIIDYNAYLVADAGNINSFLANNLIFFNDPEEPEGPDSQFSLDYQNNFLVFNAVENSLQPQVILMDLAADPNDLNRITTNFTNNYYYIDQFGDDVICTFVDECTAVELESYFFSNSTSAPLDQWDFETIWFTQFNDFPKFTLDDYVPPVEPPVVGGGGGSSGSKKNIDTEYTETTYAQEIASVLARGLVTKDPATPTNKCEALTIMSRGFDWQVTPATSTVFTDVPEWCISVAEYARVNNVVQGRTPTTLGLESPVTRNEVATMLYRELLRQNYQFKAGFQVNFQDNPQVDWAAQAIQTLANEGIIKGFDDGNFGGALSILKQDLAIMINRIQL